MSSESEIATMDVLSYHADQVGVDPETAIEHALLDGIVTETEPMLRKYEDVVRRFCLTGTLAEFRVYLERLSNRREVTSDE